MFSWDLMDVYLKLLHHLRLTDFIGRFLSSPEYLHLRFFYIFWFLQPSEGEDKVFEDFI